MCTERSPCEGRAENGCACSQQQQSWNMSSKAALLSQQREIKSPAQRLPQTISLQLPFLHCRAPELSCLIQHPCVKEVPAPEGDCRVTKPVPTSTFPCSAEAPVWRIYQIPYTSPGRIPASPFSLQNFWEALLRDVCSSVRGAEMGGNAPGRDKYFLNHTQSSQLWLVPTDPSG